MRIHMENQHFSYLGQEKIGRLLLKFSVPTIISLVLNGIYNMVDQIFIGQGVGYLGNGATNVIFPLTQMAIAFALMVGDGGASQMNLQMGAGDKKGAESTMAASLAGSLILGIVFFTGFNLFLKPLCLLFGATENTLSYALEYGRIISLGIPFAILSASTMSLIRADGSPVFAMAGLIAGCVTNLIGDPLTIFVFGWGVKGAALATILGQLVNLIMNIWYLCGHTKTVKLTHESFSGCLSRIPGIVRRGLSSFSTQIAVVLVIAVQNNLLTFYGAQSSYGSDIPLAALGVTMKVFTILNSAVMGLVSGAQPIFSYNYGARLYDRVLKCLKWVLIIAVLIYGLATVWFQVAPMSVVSIFGSSDPLYNDYSVKCLKIYLMLLTLDAFQNVASAYLQAVGKAGPAAMLVLFRQLILLIPLMLLFAKLYGVVGLLYSGPVASFAVGVLSIVLLIRERAGLRQMG